MNAKKNRVEYVKASMQRMTVNKECPCLHHCASVQSNHATLQPSMFRSSSYHKGLCAICIQRALTEARERRQAALKANGRARVACAAVFEKSNTRKDLSQLQFESDQLRQKLDSRQKEGSRLALRVARMAMENEELQKSLVAQSATYTHRLRLERLQIALLHGGALTSAIRTATLKAQSLRWHWALQVFASHCLVVTPVEDDRRVLAEARRAHARGIGKIGGLPLPHAGPELYNVLPPQELVSALRLVASATKSVAQFLGIALPHPILLRQHIEGVTDIIELVMTEPETEPDRQLLSESMSESTNSLASIGKAAKHTLSRVVHRPNLIKATGSTKHTDVATAHSSPSGPLSMHPDLVNARLQHATSVVLVESATKGQDGTRYSLSSHTIHQEEFAISLQLLQNNIVALCIRAGVPVGRLWPAEAILLNLHALQIFCQEQIEVAILEDEGSVPA
jgi:hypothetical protein